MSPTEIKILMQKYGIAPKKLFGQNFMISEGILDKIVASADLSKNDVVLEVGPGLGALTFKLAPLVRQIIAVEKDRNLVKILRARLAENNIKNVEVIEEDILKFNPITICHPHPSFYHSRISLCHPRENGDPDPHQLNLDSRLRGNDKRDDGDDKSCEYKLIANIPYYLTSALIRKFLESENKPQKMILMIQKEVAQRICPPKNVRRPTSHIKMNLLALSVQFYANAKILFYVSKDNFWPAPKVDSAVIEIAPRAPTLSRGANSELFFKIIRAGFASKRKQLASNLAQNLSLRETKQSQQKLRRHEIATPRTSDVGARNDKKQNSKEKIEKTLQKIGLNSKTRAEDLKLEDWIALMKENMI